MKQDYYKDWIIEDNDQRISFYSIGTKGKVLKRVEITRRGGNLYNLAFGDVINDGSIDDYAITNNKDIIKLFVTIFRIIRFYLIKYPNRELLFAGSTESRTRLYRMAIGNNLDELNKTFSIFGVKEDFVPVQFIKNERYYCFLVKINI